MNSKKPILIMTIIALASQSAALFLAMVFTAAQKQIYTATRLGQGIIKETTTVVPWDYIIVGSVFLALIIVLFVLSRKNLGNKYKVVGIVLAAVCVSNRVMNSFGGLFTARIYASYGVNFLAVYNSLYSFISYFTTPFSVIATAAFFMACGMLIMYRDNANV